MLLLLISLFFTFSSSSTDHSDFLDINRVYFSLEYVNGDLLENDNAYQCEKCQKKASALACITL